MRIIFDQATPVPIRPYLEGHTVRTAAQQGWDKLKNGDLLNAAEAAGFDLLLTTDKNIRYQQNLSGRKIAIVVLGRQQWPHVQLVVEAVNAATPGTYAEVESLLTKRGGVRVQSGGAAPTLVSDRSETRGLSTVFHGLPHDPETRGPGFPVPGFPRFFGNRRV